MSNQRELARLLGLSQSAVSLALRGDLSIPAATRALVVEAARKSGYHPNPYVSALMQHIRGGKKIKDQGCLAIIVDAENAADWLTHPAYREQYDAICRRAVLRGYRTECFFLRQAGMSPQKLDRILHARGIVGVILAAPRRDDSPPLNLRWNRYACVTSGYSWSGPLIDRISTHHRHHLQTAFAELQRRGYERIGFCLPRAAEIRADSNWLTGWLLCQHFLPGRQRVPHFVGSVSETAVASFRRWYERWKPDALITLNGDEVAWLRNLGLLPGRHLALVSLFHRAGSGLPRSMKIIW